ncbi:MAG: hypothetical protein HYV32_06025 [Candidatus Kerfeldbacteria bacterium]|nr:hypothetical protein [Candidatus Kerfeldbacteria bacterium]
MPQPSPKTIPWDELQKDLTFIYLYVEGQSPQQAARTAKASMQDLRRFVATNEITKIHGTITLYDQELGALGRLFPTQMWEKMKPAIQRAYTQENGSVEEMLLEIILPQTKEWSSEALRSAAKEDIEATGREYKKTFYRGAR